MAKNTSRGILGFVALFLIAASVLFMFFVILSGLKGTTPLNKTYFLQADTSTITGARALSQWTYFYICGEGNTDCGAPVPALPFGYAWIGNTANVPASLVGKHGHNTTSTYYYYIWRFGWVTYLMGFFFDVMALLTALFAPCSRLASALAGLVLMSALFFFGIGAALMTATFVKARNVFNAAGMDAQIGKYAFGWTWAAWFAMLLATVMLFAGCGASRKKDDDFVRPSTSTSTGNRGFWRRQRTRGAARGSFVDNESQRRVKDEYA